MRFRISDMLVLHVNYLLLCAALNRSRKYRLLLKKIKLPLYFCPHLFCYFVVAVGARSVVAFRVMVMFTPSDVSHELPETHAETHTSLHLPPHLPPRHCLSSQHTAFRNPLNMHGAQSTGRRIHGCVYRQELRIDSESDLLFRPVDTHDNSI